MKHLLKKSEMARLLAVAITAFACMGMWGCSDRVEFKWVGRGNMSIAGFIDDSLVVAYDCRGWLEQFLWCQYWKDTPQKPSR